MRLCIDLTSLDDNFSGIERFAASLSLALIGSGDKYILLFKNQIHPLFRGYQDSPNITCITIPGCNKLLFNQLRLPAILHKLRADCYLFPAFPIPLLSRKSRMLPVIHDITCWDEPDTMNRLSRTYFRISQRSAMKKCSRILTISAFSKQRIALRLRYPEERIRVIYCGVDARFRDPVPEADLARVRDRYRLPDTYFLSLSTIEPRKNLRLLLLAYEDLTQEDVPLPPLVLAGRKGWKTEDLLDGISEKTRKKICFTGFVEDEDLPALYRGAEAFLFPSRYEGFGIPPLEAMACETLVLSSDAASMPEVLGDAAIYFRSNDREALKEKLRQLMQLQEREKEAHLVKGKARTELFQWDREAEKLLSLIRQEIINTEKDS